MADSAEKMITEGLAALSPDMNGVRISPGITIRNEGRITVSPESVAALLREERTRCRAAVCPECRTGNMFSLASGCHGINRQVPCKAAEIWELERFPAEPEPEAWCEVKYQPNPHTEVWLLCWCVKIDASMATVLFAGAEKAIPLSMIRGVKR